MANRLLSISLGTGAAKLAEIAPNGRKVSVFSAYNLELPDGLCDDGVILDPDMLAQELSVFMNRHSIKCKKLVFVISSKRIATKEVVIPFVKEKQIQAIIQTNAPEYFPVSNIEEYALNYSILEIVQGEAKQYRLSVTATPNELLKGYDDLAKAMKLPIEVMDHGGNAILQILKNQMLPTEVAAILQLGREGTVINIMSGGVLVMQRNVSYGLDAIINAIKDAFKLSDDEAYDFVVDNDINRICQSYPEVNDVISAMMNSIGRIFEFYNSRAGENQITSIKYVGDGTMISGIGVAIEQNLAIPSSEILRLFNVDVKGRGITAEQATNFMANIGAVLKPVKLKYIPVGIEGEGADDGKLPIWAIIVAVVAAVVMSGASFGLYYFNKVKADTLQKQADTLAPMRDLERRLNDARELTGVIDGFYQSTRGANDSIHRLITDLEEILPEGMSLDALSIDNGRVSFSAGGIGKKSVAKIIMELKDLKYVSDVHIDYVSEVDDILGKYDTFTMTFSISNVHDIEGFEEETQEEPDVYEEDVYYYEDNEDESGSALESETLGGDFSENDIDTYEDETEDDEDLEEEEDEEYEEEEEEETEDEEEDNSDEEEEE